MSADSAVLLVLAGCCVVLSAVQAAGWPRAWQAVAAAALVAALVAAGDLAARTSMAELLRWATAPARRQDLAALLLAEALCYGSLAARLAQGPAPRAWRWLDYVPPPSALLALFFAQVALMLTVDGWEYGTLAWMGAAGSVLLLAAATAALRWALPDSPTRCLLRVGLHGAQAAAALWLARPPLPTAIDPVPMHGGRLALVAATVLVLGACGWLLQRRQRPGTAHLLK